MPSTPLAEPTALAQALRKAGISDLDTGTRRRAEYSSDASNYRVVPGVVAFPRHVDEIEAALSVCRDRGVALVPRGGGTSIAGNALSTGLVLDTSRHLNRVLEVDAAARTALVEPGAVLDAVTSEASKHGLRFGPDPSTHSRATIGGSIGNNACGSRALGYGRTADNVLGLQVLAGSGARFTARRYGGAAGALNATGKGPEAALVRDLIAVVSGRLAVIRTEFGRFTRQVSGYSLEHLLPENGTDLARFLVGTEGTLALTLQATVRLVEAPKATALTVLGFADMAEAAAAVPGILPYQPVALEGLDSRLVEVVRTRRGPAAVPGILPAGGGWLFIETTGDTAAEAADAGHKLAAAANCLDSAVVTGPQAAALWRIREDGAGLAARTSDGRPAHAGWEDAAVPVEQLGAYLREFEALLDRHELQGVPYGHFGDGCVHVRIDFPLGKGADRGREAYRAFVTDAATLVARYGGSVSGEHGDGRARSELLSSMYSPHVLGLFERVKGLFDPADVLNPGVLVRPARVEDDIRVAAAPRHTRGLALAYRHDGGDFSAAVHRCTGVGKCRADLQASGGVMCPSWPATREEKDTTRGRARVLQEMLAPGGPVRDWRSPEVHQALDLCLSCKGCSRDCPTGVDMASYKAEVLHQSYRRRLRPRAHYTLGWLPRWADVAARAPRLANAVTRSRLGGRLAKWGAGVDQRRSLPAFADRTFRQQWHSRPPQRPAPAGDGRGAGGRAVTLWVDSFTDHFAPEVALATAAVLEDAGYRVQVPPAEACCGLTWITTGQLDAARRTLGRTVELLAPLVDDGIPVVGVEPSCTAVLRHEALELVGGPAAERVAAGTRTLAELLRETPGWTPPSLAGVEVVAQPHCHHHAVLGWATDERLLREAGATVTRVGGCCGLAGNWGVERGHHEVSVAIAEHQLLPAVRAAGPDAVVLADGFSCRTQLDQLAGREGLHLAQLLARATGA
jgi:FAD/FMN-containing dehydrogenase/Fe-S oxidoreductase